MMETFTINPVIYLLGFFSVILLYLSRGISSLNFAQLERMFAGDDGARHTFGISMHTIRTAVNLAASLIEIVFFATLVIRVLQAFNGSWTWHSTAIFLGITMIVELIGRFLLHYIFPMRHRQHLRRPEIYLIKSCALILFPLAFLLEKLGERSRNSYFARTDDARIVQAEDTIKSMIDAGEKEGIFKEEDGELLHSIVEFSDTIVREVMTPRIDLVSIEILRSVDEFAELAVKSGYSKIPAYRNTVDEIAGILYAKDLLKVWNSRSDRIRLEELIRPAYFVPETKKVKSLLREFQKEKMHMAVVVDEYGGVAGAVTIEDLLEEIVGEIQDEYDVEPDKVTTVSDDNWLVDGKMDLDELSEIIGIEFPEENYETLGGFLFDRFGRVPAPGETTEYENVQLIINEADDRRILKVQIQKKDENGDIKSENGNE